MPLVRIDTLTTDPDRLAALGAAVHDAMVQTLDVPAADRFQVLRGGSPAEIVYDARYLGVERDDDIVLVQVSLRAGRTEAQKKRFYRLLAAKAKDAGTEPRNLVVVLTENTLADWSFGDGIAQYLETPPASA